MNFLKIGKYNALILLFLLLVVTTAFGQNKDKPVYVDGTVKESGSKLSGVNVLLFRDGKKVDEFSTSTNGKFQFELAYEHDYVLEFTKEGYVSKKISVNTKGIPEEEKSFGFEFGGWEVSLFQYIEGFNTDILKRPIGKIAYSAELGALDYDVEYTNSIKEELMKLQAELEAKQREAAEAAKRIEEGYKSALADGAKSLKTSDYQGAKIAFENAIKLKPSEQFPKDQLKIINQQLAASGETEKKYQDQLAVAKGEADKRNYDAAIAAYQLASGIRPTEKFPKDKITELTKLRDDSIKNASAAEKQKRDTYNNFVANGEKEMGFKSYEKAIKEYEQALALYPDEAYPKKQVAEAKRLLAAQSAIDSQYQALLSQADKKFTAKEYKESRSLYDQAYKVKTEEYALKRMTEIDGILAEIARKANEVKVEAENNNKKEEEYKKYLSDGDAAIVTENFSAAKAAYQSAMNLKPSESYPKQKLNEIDGLIAAKVNAQKQKDIDERYNKFVVDADQLFNASNFESAIAKYREALDLKASERYPTEQIKAAEAKISELKSKEKEADLVKQREAKYANFIKQADIAFELKKYSEALEGYSQATQVKPNDSYSNGKIAEIGTLIRQGQEKAKAEAAQKEINDKYQEKIVAADKAFDSKDFTSAISYYEAALGVKPDQKYPAEKIVLAKEMLDKELMRIEQDKVLENYNAKVKAGDSAFESKDYTAAKTAYNEAINVLPTKPYPKDKIAQIEKIEAEEKLRSQQAAAKAAEDEKFNSLVAAADKLFEDKKYTESIEQYTAVLALRADDNHSKLRLIEANKILLDLENQRKLNEELNKKNEEYTALTTAADKALSAKDYSTARTNYSAASIVKPDESYPKDQLQKIVDMLAADSKKAEEEAKAKALKAKYDNIIKLGDAALLAQELESARQKYIDAEAILPNEKYPQDKIQEVDRLIAERNAKLEKDRFASEELRKKELQYKTLVQQGDQNFALKNFDVAKGKFEQALVIKPGDDYCTKKLAEIRTASTKPVTTTTPVTVEKDVFQQELAKKYPQGITEEISQEGNKKIVRRIVVNGNLADEYKMVTYNWGGKYFFKNDKSISEAIWQLETVKR